MTSRNWTLSISQAPRAGAGFQIGPLRPGSSGRSAHLKIWASTGNAAPTARAVFSGVGKNLVVALVVAWWAAASSSRTCRRAAGPGGGSSWARRTAGGWLKSEPTSPTARRRGRPSWAAPARTRATSMPSPSRQPKVGFGARQGVDFGDQCRACADEFRTHKINPRRKDSASCLAVPNLAGATCAAVSCNGTCNACNGHPSPIVRSLGFRSSDCGRISYAVAGQRTRRRLMQ